MLVSYFTFRALKETLTQIQETDVSPDKGEYKWLYEFASPNNPNDAHSQVYINNTGLMWDYGKEVRSYSMSHTLTHP